MTSHPSLQELADFVGLQLGVDEVGPKDHLQSDLGAESADILNLALAIEDAWGLFVSDEALGKVKTIDDLYALFEGDAE